MRSPYDPSAEEAFFRNEKRLKEELVQFENNRKQIDLYLEKAGVEKEEFLTPLRDPPKKKGLPKQNWVRI